MTENTPLQSERIVRIVYDGPARSGKTTSIRALASSTDHVVRGAVVSPEEISGRTVFFDWLEFSVGELDGRPVRCQVLGAPGQLSLAERRFLLLERADAVVFVADSDPDRLPSVREAYDSLRPFLKRDGEPAVGVVVQANKRDLPNAIPIDRLRAALAEDEFAVILDAVAADGTGVAHAFDFALRLALDRALEWSRQGGASQQHRENDPQSLVDAMLDREMNRHRTPSATPSARVRTRLAEDGEQRTPGTTTTGGAPQDLPRLPPPEIPPGRIWPAMSGRIILKEAELSGMRVRRLPNGSVASADPGRWRAVSSDVHTTLEDALRSLRELARVHERVSGVLSPRRCLAVHESGGAWRLWQIVSWQPSLRDLLDGSLLVPTAAARRDVLRECAGLFFDSLDRFRVGDTALPSTLDTVGALGGLSVFVEFFPTGPRTPLREHPPAEALRRAFTVQLEEWLPSADLGHGEFVKDTGSRESAVDSALRGLLLARRESARSGRPEDDGTVATEGRDRGRVRG